MEYIVIPVHPTTLMVAYPPVMPHRRVVTFPGAVTGATAPVLPTGVGDRFVRAGV